MKNFIISIKNWLFGPKKIYDPYKEMRENLLKGEEKIPGDTHGSLRGQRINNGSLELNAATNALSGVMTALGSPNIISQTTVANNQETNIFGRATTINPNNPATNQAVPALT